MVKYAGSLNIYILQTVLMIIARYLLRNKHYIILKSVVVVWNMSNHYKCVWNGCHALIISPIVPELDNDNSHHLFCRVSCLGQAGGQSLPKAMALINSGRGQQPCLRFFLLTIGQDYAGSMHYQPLVWSLGTLACSQHDMIGGESCTIHHRYLCFQMNKDSCGVEFI